MYVKENRRPGGQPVGFFDKMLGRAPANKKTADVSDVRGGHSSTAREVAPTPQPRFDAPVQKAAPPPVAPPRTYTVQKGDSLSLIAKRLLGDMKRWTEIFSLNKDVIGDDPDRIYPGQTLKLPA
jgi:nucleoid-associated protein YgaU